MTWSPATAGPALVWDATAFAASTSELVGFGGTTGYVAPTTTRLFKPATGAWTTLSAPKRGWPQARTSALMAWDPVRRIVVLFGGRNASGAALQDTWGFNPATRTWTQLVGSCRTSACPPARFGYGIAWSSALSRVVVFGGQGTSTMTGAPEFNDVWTFDGTAWAKLTTSGGPAARHLHGMTEDPQTGRIVVFGGIDAHNTLVDSATWVLNTRAEVGMAWLGSVGAVVVATGEDGVNCMTWFNSVWAFDASARDWRQLTTTGSTPTPRNAATLTANPIDGSAILNGGTGDNQIPLTLKDRTWILR